MKRKQEFVLPSNYKTNYFYRWYIANSLYSFGLAEKDLYLIIGGERGKLNASLHFGLGQESHVITEVLRTHCSSVKMWPFNCMRLWSCATALQGETGCLSHFSINYVWLWLTDDWGRWFGPFWSKQVMFVLCHSPPLPEMAVCARDMTRTAAVQLNPPTVWSCHQDKGWNCHVVGSVV